MFFRKRKILKIELERLERFRNSLENHVRDLKGDKIFKVWMQYIFIDGIYSLNHNGGRGTLKDRIELEEEKIDFLKSEFPKIYKDFNKNLDREIKIDELLNGN